MRFRESLWAEQVGDEVLILEPDSGVVHRLTGDAAAAALCLTSGSLSDATASGIAELRAAGLIDDLEPEDPDQLVSRRRVLALGGVVAGVGVVSMALPPAAAAASGDTGGATAQPTASVTPGDGLVEVSASGG